MTKVPGKRRLPFILIVLLLVLSVAGGTLQAAQGAQQGAEPIVIVADDVPRDAAPSGQQVLRIAGPTEGPQTLDPALSRDLASAFLVRQVYRGLTRLDRNLEPVPELADRIEISADGLEYQFHLRDSARFHDGRTITADDVVFSITRSLDPAIADGEAVLLGGPTFLADIDGAAEMLRGETTELRGVQIVDEQTVLIRLAAPRSTFLMRLASAPASIVDQRDVEQGGEWWREPNGSGPFEIDAWEASDHMTLTRFDDFFAGAAPLERVEVALGTNAFQTFNLYQAGDIDVDTVTIDGVDRVMAPESTLRDELTVTPLFAVDYIAFRTDTPPMDDPAIRRAVQLAFPRDRIANVGFDGHVAPAAGLIPHGMLDEEWPTNATPYDLNAARQAIAESSYGAAENVPPLRIYGADGIASGALRDVLQQNLGLQVEVISVEWSEYVDGLSRRSYPAYELYWGADYPDPESLLLTLFGSESADNYVDYVNPAMDELLRQAAEEQDPEVRVTLYAEAQQLLMDDNVVIPIYYDVAYTLAKPYVKGLEVTPLGILRLDSVWLEH